MLEMVALQNVVVEHKRALAAAIGEELTKQVRTLGLPDAKVWISFDGEGPASAQRVNARKAKRKPQAGKVGPGSKAARKAFYMCNYWRKKKGETPLSFDEWQQSKKDTPEKN